MWINGAFLELRGTIESRAADRWPTCHFSQHRLSSLNKWSLHRQFVPLDFYEADVKGAWPSSSVTDVWSETEWEPQQMRTFRTFKSFKAGHIHN